MDMPRPIEAVDAALPFARLALATLRAAAPGDLSGLEPARHIALAVEHLEAALGLLLGRAVDEAVKESYRGGG